ncbi:MAG: hypothetical protein IPK52_22450 [Chloroflexi bacterium]|nr:hypothetical protein [Chloroflexota bacterium]
MRPGTTVPTATELFDFSFNTLASRDRDHLGEEKQTFTLGDAGIIKARRPQITPTQHRRLMYVALKPVSRGYGDLCRLSGPDEIEAQTPLVRRSCQHRHLWRAMS